MGWEELVITLVKSPKRLASSIVHWRRPKLLVLFDNMEPFRRDESDDMGYRWRHYSLKVRNNLILSQTQNQLRVVLNEIQPISGNLALPVELRYRDRSSQRHSLNPSPDEATIDVLSFEIVVGIADSSRDGFWIHFHGDGNRDYSITCGTHTIRIDISSSEQKPISHWFEIGLEGGQFFMRKATNS